MPKRFCLDCRALFDAATGKSRCPTCQDRITKVMDAKRGSTTERGLGWSHQQRVKREVDKTAACWMCGKPGTPADPITADHETPRAAGGVDSPLLPAHRSCNARRGGARQQRGGAH
ncbi:HNH endonuclease [Streptacidiphilus rugosus]|uniref:HNH endonuclease n=1 Tax=Streptacidiphilus rugosus TaxID=405783 RepID=UPI00068F62A0|nr:HNH endonuclease [Streptacidiphilus rugosus]